MLGNLWVILFPVGYTLTFEQGFGFLKLRILSQPKSKKMPPLLVALCDVDSHHG